MNQSPSKAPHYTYSIWQLALSLLAVLGLAAGAMLALVFVLFASVGSLAGLPQAPQNETATMFLLAGGLAACGLLVIPSAYYALRRLSGKPAWRYPRFPSILRPTLLIFAWPVVILLGHWVTQNSNLAWLLLPVLHVLAIGLPVLWIVYLATRGLPLGSPQRLSGVMASGLVLGPTIIMILEIGALIIFGVFGFFILISQPGLVDQLSELAKAFQQGVVSEQELLEGLLPWLSRPQVLLGVLFFVSLVVPMIEEALKPIGVWLLAGFKLSPAAGFAAGAISGAGFAFFESLGLASSGLDWTASVAARFGTDIIHIFNAGLMGWALTMAWRKKRYLNLGLTYLVVVGLHGAWNALAVLNIYSSAVVTVHGFSLPGWLVWLGTAAPYILAGSALVLFGLLLWMNSKLRQEAALQAKLEIQASAATRSDSEPGEVVL